jgi:hypothetical protein
MSAMTTNSANRVSVVNLVTSPAMFVLLALLLGIRHAVEPDHLAAMSTLVGGRRAAWTGAAWGLGHALSLLAVGALLLILRAHMPGTVENGFETAVSLVLIALGVRSLYKAGRAPETSTKRPLLVGLLHGLAGSGALTAIALASMPSLATGIAFIAAFGTGAALGMALLAGVAGFALRMLASPRAQRILQALAGALSIGLGLSRLVTL